MSKQSNTYVRVTIQGDGADFDVQTPDQTNTACPSSGGTPLSLTGAYQDVTVPSGAIGFLLVPSASSSVVKTIKGVTGDTGSKIHPAKPYLRFFESSPPATFGILSASAEVVTIHWL